MENATQGRRYCEDCRFCQVGVAGLSTARCGNPKAPKISSGDQYVARQFDRPTFASIMRDNADKCGPDAAWFEAKQSEAEAA